VAARSKTGKNTKPKRVVRSFQQAPTPERYKEIQQALVNKGYLQGEPTGEWGPDSVDALRRFQTDQNLIADGKIGSLSLIALGLGPKRLTAQTGPQQPAAEPPK
jgi:peptidoglycan hydrolase-like protein with peptidoglycan-binding domain